MNYSILGCYFFSGYLNNDAGASHGGEGGKDGSSNRASAYDNFMEPTEMGTGCGDAKGGGFLKLQALVTLELAGIITAKYVIHLLICGAQWLSW